MQIRCNSLEKNRKVQIGVSKCPSFSAVIIIMFVHQNHHRHLNCYQNEDNYGNNDDDDGDNSNDYTSTTATLLAT